METVSACCRVCNSCDVQEWLHPREMMFGMREQFTYFRCAACGCLQLKDIPSELGKYYPAGYYSYRGIQDAPASWRNRIKRKFFYPRMIGHMLGQKNIAGRLLCHLLNHPSLPDWLPALGSAISFDAAMLDVGCGSGSNLLMLRDLGFTNLRGVDPFISRSLSFHGDVRIDKCDLQAVTGKFDCIMFHHVFEHLANPLETMRKARGLLADGGQIMIRIPLSDSVAAQKYRENWVQLDAPRHVALHTRKSMDWLAGKSGLKLKRIRYDSNGFQFWGSEQYQRDIPLFTPESTCIGPAKDAFSPEQMTAFDSAAEQLNQQEAGDQAVFIYIAA